MARNRYRTRLLRTKKALTAVFLGLPNSGQCVLTDTLTCAISCVFIIPLLPCSRGACVDNGTKATGLKSNNPESCRKHNRQWSAIQSVKIRFAIFNLCTQFLGIQSQHDGTLDACSLACCCCCCCLPNVFATRPCLTLRPCLYLCVVTVQDSLCPCPRGLRFRLCPCPVRRPHVDPSRYVSPRLWIRKIRRQALGQRSQERHLQRMGSQPTPQRQQLQPL